MPTQEMLALDLKSAVNKLSDAGNPESERVRIVSQLRPLTGKFCRLLMPKEATEVEYDRIKDDGKITDKSTAVAGIRRVTLLLDIQPKGYILTRRTNEDGSVSPLYLSGGNIAGWAINPQAIKWLDPQHPLALDDSPMIFGKGYLGIEAYLDWLTPEIVDDFEAMKKWVLGEPPSEAGQTPILD